jgi:hypothetical protein
MAMTTKDDALIEKMLDEFYVDTDFDGMRAALAVARKAILEEAAAWHDDRRRHTPDAFEMEFHEGSAAAIRALANKDQSNG